MVPVQRRPDLCDDPIHGELMGGRSHGHPYYLPFKVLALVTRGHPRTYDGHPVCAGGGLVDEDQEPTRVAGTGSFPSRNHR